jgi:NRAMP (natural resistance-associated macrophage protein)-like metal ion transporter
MPPLLKKLKKLFGPSIITGASDDDPSGIATYTQAGAGFGLHMLWMAIFTLPMMVAVQEMCARIGLVTRMGLTGLLRTYYPKWVMWIMIGFSAPAIVFNISANVSGMAAVGQLLIPSIPIWVFSVFFSVLLLFFMIRLPYRRIASILQYLCLVLVCYIAVPFLVKVDWPAVIRSTFVPSFEFNKNSFSIIVALLGTTISPYLFFWQTSMEVEEMNDRKSTVDMHLIQNVRTEIKSGMAFSNLIFYFIVLTAGLVLFPAGIQQVETVDQAALALKPLVGEGAYLLFAIGVLGTGLLAIPVLAGSLSYMISEVFNWSEGLNKKWMEAPGFYLIMIASLLLAGLIQLLGIPPVKALIYTAIGYGLTAPVLIGIILHICNNKEIMGEFVNDRTSNILGILTFLVMTIAAICLLLVQE